MLKFKRVYNFSQWPLIDLIDHNHQMQLIKTPLPQVNLQNELGSNYQRYIQTSLHCKYISHIQQPNEVKLLNNNNIFTQDDRLFTTYDQLQQVRECESYNKSILKELEPEGQFTIDAMQTYKPRQTCEILNKNQLLLINIPININEQEIIQFVYSQTKQNVQVQIQTCSLNFNAYAILTFQNEAEQYKQMLNYQQFNGILQECKSIEDTADECIFNRTIVITNINKSYSLQEVLHYIGQYGRVINAVIPLEIQNVDLPLYQDIIDTLTEPCKIEILNVMTGEIDIEFYPSFEQFENLYKDYPEYYDPNLAMTIFEYQQQMDEKQDQLRLHRLLNQKTIKCIKVPEHLQEQYRKLWIPEINVEKPQKTNQYDLNAKIYKNRGYCVCTFPSKAMAQRALYTINSEGTQDLAVLPLQLLNTPKFYPEHNTHSNQIKYGGKFRIENLSYTKVRAMKSWQNMELYQIDLIYNLKQLEKIRLEISKVRDQTINEIQKYDDFSDDRFEEKKQEIRQNVYSELNQNDEFKKFVENKTFSETLNQFQDNVSTISNNKPGRKFDLDINSEQYQNYIKAMQKQAQNIQLKQTSYAEKLIDKYQSLYIDDWIQKKDKNITKSDDNLLSLLQNRLLNKYHNREQELDDNIEEFQDETLEMIDYAEEYHEQVDEISAAFATLKNKTEFVEEEIKQRNYLNSNDDKEEIFSSKKQAILKRKPKINRQEFCTLITNPVFLKKQSLKKHSEFLDEIKRLLLGEDIKEEHLIAIHPLNYKDQLKLSLLFAKDNQGNPFLTEQIIEQIKQFDIPKESAQLIKQQEDNRRKLINEITHEQIIRIKEFSKQSYTQKLIILDKHGLTTETFEVTDENADIQKMVEDLNNFVAVGTEVYDCVEDPLSKKRYIVKNEKPYVKYNLDAFDIKKEGFDSLEKQLIEILESNGFSYQDSLRMLDELQNKGNIPDELLDLIDKLPDETSDDIEEIHKQQGLTRKQFELAKSLDFRNNLQEIQEDVNQQAFIKDISKKYSPLTNDTFVKDHEDGRLKIKKDKKYLVPKLKKY